MRARVGVGEMVVQMQVQVCSSASSKVAEKGPAKRHASPEGKSRGGKALLLIRFEFHSMG